MAKRGANEAVRYRCLACAVANDFRPTSRNLCAIHDPGRKKRKADAESELQAEQRRMAALEALRDQHLHSDAEEVRSVTSEASRTITTAKPTAKAATGTRPISSFLTHSPRRP